MIASATVVVAVVDGEDDHRSDQDDPEVVVTVHRICLLAVTEVILPFIDILCRKQKRCETQSEVRIRAKRPFRAERIAGSEMISLLTANGKS